LGRIEALRIGDPIASKPAEFGLEVFAARSVRVYQEASQAISLVRSVEVGPDDHRIQFHQAEMI